MPEMHISEHKPVGIFIPLLHSSGMNKFLADLCGGLAAHGFKTLIFSSYSDFYHGDKNDEGELYVMKLGMKASLSAMIIFGELIKDDKVTAMIAESGIRQDIPVFTIDHEYEGAVNIRYGYGETFRKIVDHVIEVHGAKDLRMISGMRGNPFSTERNEAFLRSLEAHGLPFSEKYIYYGDFWEVPARQAVSQIVSDCGGRLPDAIICANDVMAIAASTELEKHGIHVPDGVIVTGFDGLDRAANNLPSITTAEPDHKSACRFITDAVINAEKGIMPTPQTKTFGFDIRCEQSCGCKHSSNAMAGVINAELNESIAGDRVFRMGMDHMVLNNVDGRDIISALKGCEHHIGGVTFRGMELYLDPTIFGNPNGLTCHKALAARTLPESSNYSVPFTEADEHALCTKLMYDASDTILFVPIHKQEVVYGYAAAQHNCINVKIAERLYDCIAHMNMMLTSIEAATKLSATVKQLDKMYIRDPLTALLNRRGFRRELPSLIESATAEGRRIALISVDMDGLKYINDSFGHSEGDHAIAALAGLLTELADGGICARFGGDEYIAAAAVDGDSVPDYTARLTEMLNKLNDVSGKPYRINASIGVEIADPEELTDRLEEIIKLADDKMYRRKRLSKLSRGFHVKLNDEN